MTADDFRALAMSLPDVVESAHMNHPDFRVGGKIFATLGYPSDDWGCVMLTPDEQAVVCQAEPDVFKPASGAWGRGGSTHVSLRPARKASVRTALEAAWRRRATGEPAAARKKPSGASRPAGARRAAAFPKVRRSKR